MTWKVLLIQKYVAYTTVIRYTDSMRYQPNQCIGARFRRISRIVDSIYRTHLANVPVTEQQMNILFYLKMKGTCEQGAIGREWELERSTVSRNVKALAAQGLVEKSNEYRPTLRLTVKGMDMVTTLLPIWEDIMDQLTETLGKDTVAMIQTFEAKLLRGE